MKMKIDKIIIASIIILVSCTDAENKSATNVNPDTSSLTITHKVVEAKDIKIRLYKHSGLDFDEDGRCLNNGVAQKEKITEVKLEKNNKPIICSEGQYIQKVTLEGNVEGVTIIFFDKAKKEIFKKEGFNIVNEISYSTVNHTCENELDIDLKEKSFVDWFGKAEKINILFQGKIILEQSWKNKGWYRQ